MFWEVISKAVWRCEMETKGATGSKPPLQVTEPSSVGHTEWVTKVQGIYRICHPALIVCGKRIGEA